ncbi:MAG: hypothetical protein JXB62_17335, partial [Pirellulales bacterium]|nr:hypothetical protein [Pirellulales bacterium]
MQHKLLPVVFWIPVALAVGLWVVIPCAAQDAPPWTGSGATPPYGTGAPLPYGANGYGVVPRAPTEPGVASRPASWPATPAPAHQWSGPRYPANPPYPMYPTQPPYLAERQRTAYTPPSPPPDDRPYRGPPTQS